MMCKQGKAKLCKKVAFSLRKPTALFRKMGTRIFFLEQPLVIRKIRVPLCSKVRNLFVEQSAPSQFPNKTDYQAFTRIVPRGTFCALRHEMREKRRFQPLLRHYMQHYLFVEQCSTNVPRNPVLCSTMIINRLTKSDCATKFRGTLCSTPLFSDVPRNVPRHQLLDLGVILNQELGMRNQELIKLGFRS